MKNREDQEEKLTTLRQAGQDIQDRMKASEADINKNIDEKEKMNAKIKKTQEETKNKENEK